MAIAHVRDTGKIRGNGVATSSANFPALPSAGNYIATQIAGWNTANYTTTQVTDNQSNTHSPLAQAELPSSGRNGADIFGAENIGTPSGTFTVLVDPQDASGNFLEWVSTEFSGVATADSLDQTGTNSSTSGDANVTAAGANTQADMLVLAVCSVSNDDTALNLSNPTGYTQLAVNDDSTATIGMQACYRIVSAVETSSASWSHDNTSQSGWTASIATLRAAAGGGGTANRKLTRLLRTGMMAGNRLGF